MEKENKKYKKSFFFKKYENYKGRKRKRQENSRQF